MGNTSLQETPTTEKPTGEKKKRISPFYIVLFCLVVVIFAWRVYWVNTHEMVQVSGDSMNTTLRNDDWLLLDKTTKAKRGDVIVVDVSGYDAFEGTGTKLIIKRLIAIEGDMLYCNNGEIQIRYAGTGQFVSLEESYAYYTDKEFYSFDTYEVKKGEIFFLGDNRNNSVDSRYQEGASRLNCLYKASDIYGVVSSWSIENKEFLETIFVTIPETIQYVFTGKKRQ